MRCALAGGRRHPVFSRTPPPMQDPGSAGRAVACAWKSSPRDPWSWGQGNRGRFGRSTFTDAATDPIGEAIREDVQLDRGRDEGARDQRTTTILRLES